MTEKLTICLVGPKRSGKSSLLATAPDSIVQGAHGYPPDLRPAMQAISQSEFDPLALPSTKFGLLESPADNYQKLRRSFVESDKPHDQPTPAEHFFRLTLNGASPQKGACLLRVVDADGDVAVPPDNAQSEPDYGQREFFAARLSSAEAIIVAAPLLRVEDCGWVLNMARFFDQLAQSPNRNLRRVVVAFTQYERLFTNLGPSAFTYACDPAVALYVIRKYLVTANWVASLRSLESGRANIDVRFGVTSAFGFTKRFQNPNLDPHQKGDRRFRRVSVSGPRSLNEFWRPFLTADPFLFAATGLGNAFTFAFGQIDGSTPSPRPAFEAL
jgi:hypothetical protein